jgi:hypothetical protein
MHVYTSHGKNSVLDGKKKKEKSERKTSKDRGAYGDTHGMV